MKTKLLFNIIICIVFSAQCIAQAGEWIWLKGDSIPNQLGNFGTQGVSSPTNNPPSLYESCEWTDLNGNFWLFGGISISATGRHNALWKYEPSTNQWTWMKGASVPGDTGHYGTQGVPSPNNNPCPRVYAAASWSDNQGNLWLFGGMGNYSPSITSYYSDLWRYNIFTNEWTWMKGPNVPNQLGIYGTQGIPSPSNNPGARIECAAAWTDNSGDLWLFGGGGYGPSLRFNDLWRYNILTNEWTWMKGSSLGDQPANYGVKGLESSLSNPDGRWSHCRWKDNAGMFWLFGSVSYFGPIHNDLWRFNISTNNWTWMSGDSITNSANVYGTKCIASLTNMPGARYENRAAWTDHMGNLVFFGGTSNFTGPRNDMWRYCISSNQWVWISGDSISNPSGSWGSLGVSSPTNKPNRRFGSPAWKDSNGHLYFFGGNTYNDLWKYTLDTTCGVCPPSIGVNEIGIQDNEIEVYPNPTTGELTIIIHRDYLRKVEFTLTNLLGEKVFAETENNIGSARIKKININNLANGVYILTVILDERKIVRKIEKL